MESKIYDFSFGDFRLLSVHFELKKDYKITKNIEISTSLSLNHEFIPRDKNLQITMKIEVCGDKLPFFISAEAIGFFHFANYKTEMPPSDLDKIARINCAAIIFPYLREAVADIVRRSGLPQLNLPPINFVEFYKKSDDSKKAPRKKIKANTSIH